VDRHLRILTSLQGRIGDRIGKSRDAMSDLPASSNRSDPDFWCRFGGSRSTIRPHVGSVCGREPSRRDSEGGAGGQREVKAAGRLGRRASDDASCSRSLPSPSNRGRDRRGHEPEPNGPLFPGGLMAGADRRRDPVYPVPVTARIRDFRDHLKRD